VVPFNCSVYKLIEHNALSGITGCSIHKLICAYQILFYAYTVGFDGLLKLWTMISVDNKKIASFFRIGWDQIVLC
jgi:hypothetical protein